MTKATVDRQEKNMKASKIKYQITGEYGLWQHYKSEGVLLEVLIENVDDGYIQIDEVQSNIKDGVATLDLGVLKDGTYEPTLILDNRIVHLESIKKSDGTIAPPRTSESTVRRLLKRVKTLELTTDSLLERLAAIEEKMRTDVLF